jgi:hypothetical protein
VTTALSGAGNFTNGATGTLNFNFTGALTLGGTFDASTSGNTVNWGAAGAETVKAVTYHHLTLSNSGAKDITGLSTVNGDLTLSGTATTTNSGTLVVAGTLTTTGTTFTNNGTLTVTTALSGTGGLTQGTNSILNLGGTCTITTLTATASGNTLNYTGASQTVKAVTYLNLTLSGSGIPVLTSVTTINGNLTLSGTVSATTAADMIVGGNLDVGSGTALTLAGYTFSVTGTTSVAGTLTNSSATGTKTFSGDVTIQTNGVWNETAAAVISYGGSLTHNGTTFTASTGTHTFTGTNKTIGGSSAIAIPSLTINGTTTNQSTIGLTVSTTLAGASTLTNDTNAILNIGAATVGPTLTAIASSNTVNYNSTTQGQTVKGTTYVNLTITKSGQTATLGGDTIVNGLLNISAGALDVDNTNNYALHLHGDYTNNGTFTAQAGTVTLSGSAKQTLSGTMTNSSAFYDLTITNNSGSYGGSCGSITPSVDFNAAATVTHNYTITTASVKVEYQTLATYTFTNINWSGSNGNPIVFRNSEEANKWNLNVSGTQTVHYVDVSRSDASGVNQINAYDGTNTDCNNNTKWAFLGDWGGSY